MREMKLNQVLAVEKEVKANVSRQETNIYHLFQKSELFNGFSKTYTPKDEEGEVYPPENKKVVSNAADLLNTLSNTLTELFDVTLTKDAGNTLAKADIVVDGIKIAENVPSTFIIFLEKKLVDIRTNINSIPTLDINEDWNKDSNSNLYKTDTIQTHKTKKSSKPIVLYEATDKHPAQTQMITEDDVVGYWNTVKQSGAISIPEKTSLLERIEKLIKAVKVAREEANSQVVQNKQIGDAIFAYLLK